MTPFLQANGVCQNLKTTDGKTKCLYPLLKEGDCCFNKWIMAEKGLDLAEMYIVLLDNCYIVS